MNLHENKVIKKEAQQKWEDVKKYIGNTNFLLGPQFSFQISKTPKHLLFVLSRYKFAAKLLASKPKGKILEVGCSEGLGTLILGEEGHKIVGIDTDQDAIQYAIQNIQDKTEFDITFYWSDILTLNSDPFDAVISLDVIEHISKKDEEVFIKAIHRHLHDNGFLCLGTPNISAQMYASEPSKIGHINLFSAERLQKLLMKYFQNVFIFGMNDEVVHTGFYPMCHYLIALACGKK